MHSTEKKNFHSFLSKLLKFDIFVKPVLANVATDYNHHM